MCGRYQLLVTWERLVELYGAEALLPQAPAEQRVYNIAPSQPVAVIVDPGSGTLELTAMRWGFPAPWLARDGKDPFSRSLINAKSEEAAKKRTWSASLKQRRCVVPATGFYEWMREGSKRFPLLFKPGEGEVLHMAGLWSEFDRKGEAVQCVTLLTTAANATMAQVHDRMPVLLSPEDLRSWLDPGAPVDLIEGLMAPAPDDLLVVTEVNTALNSWRSESAEVLVADWSRKDRQA